MMILPHFGLQVKLFINYHTGESRNCSTDRTTFLKDHYLDRDHRQDPCLQDQTPHQDLPYHPDQSHHFLDGFSS